MLSLIPECSPRQRGKTWLLYPLLATKDGFKDRVHDGTARVLVVADGTGDGPYSNFFYCGAVFHPKSGDPKNRDLYFEPCDEAA